MEWFTNTAASLSSRLGRNSATVSALRPIYDRTLDFLYAESGIPVQACGETFRVCSRVRKFVSLEEDVHAYLKTNIPAGGTVLDVGAFLGLYAILAARCVGARGRVVAFEPTPTSLPFLHRHLAMNDVQQNVTLLACAVGREHGTVDFFQHPDAYLNSVGVADPTVEREVTVVTRVPMLSIDEACMLFDLRPDVMRIDVQGLEAEVLRGAAKTIERQPQLKIIIEIHPQLWAMHDLDKSGFCQLLRDLGLEATSPEGGPPVFAPDAHLVLLSARQMAK